MNFYKITKELLKNRPPGLSLQTIAEDLKISYSWISKFSAGTLKNPSYKKLQSLYDYLVRVRS